MNFHITSVCSASFFGCQCEADLLLSAMHDDDWVKKCMEYEVEGLRPRGRPKRTWRYVVREDCQARKLNKEDAMDHCKWRMIKDVRWSGCVWVGECFFWYRPTRVVPDKRPLNGRVCVPCWAPVPAEHLSILISSSSVSSVTAKSSAYSSSYVRATLNSLDMASMTITNKNGLNAVLEAYPLDIVCFC